jgi:hypothetical protein
MRKSIYLLAHEDDSELYSTGSGEITPEDMIESQADHDEFLETAASAQTYVNAIEESDDIINVTEDIADNIDEKLEQPQNVTADDVMVAQESMRIICHRYGIAPEAVLGRRLSHESASVNPIHSLRLAREDAKEIMKTVINNIRILFKQLIVSIKKLYAKAVVLLSRTEKVANNLIKKIADYGEAPADAKFSDSEVSKITSKLGAVIVSIGGKLTKNSETELNDFIKILQDVNHLKTYTHALKLVISDGANFARLTPEEANQNSKNVTENIYKIFNKIDYGPIFKKVLEATGHNKFVSVPKGTIIPYAINGTKVRTFIFDEPGNLKSSTLTVAPEALKAITISIPSKASIIKLITAVLTAAKKSNDYEHEASSIVNEGDKYMNEVYEKYGSVAHGEAGSRTLKTYVTTVRTIAANIAIDSILAQVNGTKAILIYCNIAAKKLTKPNK